MFLFTHQAKHGTVERVIKVKCPWSSGLWPPPSPLSNLLSCKFSVQRPVCYQERFWKKCRWMDMWFKKIPMTHTWLHVCCLRADQCSSPEQCPEPWDPALGEAGRESGSPCCFAGLWSTHRHPTANHWSVTHLEKVLAVTWQMQYCISWRAIWQKPWSLQFTDDTWTYTLSHMRACWLLEVVTKQPQDLPAVGEWYLSVYKPLIHRVLGGGLVSWLGLWAQSTTEDYIRATGGGEVVGGEVLSERLDSVPPWSRRWDWRFLLEPSASQSPAWFLVIITGILWCAWATEADNSTRRVQ